MKYISTRNSQIFANSCEAVYKGLAPDGGLFVSEKLPLIDFSLEDLLSFDYRSLTIRILNLMLPDFGPDVIRRCVNLGYKDKFDVPECVDIKHVGKCSYLELYHGPTSAFKDMALCVLPYLVTEAARILGKKEKTVILTATSGDTGKAALEGFADVPGTGIVVIYPQNGVSDIQKAQMQTQSGSNVYVCGIDGNFDDAQSAVKKSFGELSVDGVNFSSANSINIGRLAPQISYYFYAYAQMVKDSKIRLGDSLNFSVPTGNFGDILAGWIAKQMGLPVGRLLCASNKNNILSDFINTGVYDCRREFFTTQSPSMDILISSNLERLLFYASGCDSSYIKNLMSQLASDKVFKVNSLVLANIQKDFDCGWASEAQCSMEIKRSWDCNQYLMDTHTSVASFCSRQMNYREPCVVLSTANPYKFSSSILSSLGADAFAGASGFDAMDKLYELTKVGIPQGLVALRKKQKRFTDVINPRDLTSKVVSILGGLHE